MLDAAGARLIGRALRTRSLVRAPIWIYRAGLGFLFGTRVLLLEHTGRRSGRRRYVVLEVVERPSPTDYVVVSGFGSTADWYRNIRAHPEVRVSNGLKRRMSYRASPMSAEESGAAIQRYAAQHPTAWKNLRAAIESATDSSVDTMPMVLLHVAANAR